MAKQKSISLNHSPEEELAHPDIENVLFSREQINHRVIEMSDTITSDYQTLGATELTIVGITNGAVVFVSDLLRGVRLHTRFDTVRVTSYYDYDSPVALPKILAQGKLRLDGKHVLLVDDILDTGNTLSLLRKTLLAQNPVSLRTCVLLDKKSRRVTPFEAEYVGFDLPDVFVVGYGLDYAERYRNLPYIGTLKIERRDTSSWDD
ncbi:MAG: hypoxanthine phosphoribosyltransferase [Puniceicoccales bacterium]|jgi:hypoxanthine phosphoribosyltransferase|nr:hypoxanthine phosphoribosyltransferase [Puniceicoccales bacterium]